jgi:ribonuclease D/dephospho-CoA kinase
MILGAIAMFAEQFEGNEKQEDNVSLSSGCDHLQARFAASDQLELNTNSLVRTSSHYKLPVYNSPTWQTEELITTQADFCALAKLLSSEQIVAIDTETFGLGSEPINTRLSLIQIGIPSGVTRQAAAKGRTFLIDVVALLKEAEKKAIETRAPSENPIAALKEFLEDKTKTKIVQQGSFEKEQFARYGISLAGYSDTLERSRRIAPGLVSHALQAQCAEYLGYAMSKEEQKSGWGRRPLTPVQVTYALLDPEITFKVWRVQEELLTEATIDKRLSASRLLIELSGVLAERWKLELESLPKSIEHSAYHKALKELAKKQLLKAYTDSNTPANEDESEISLEVATERSKELTIVTAWGSGRVTPGIQSLADANKLSELMPEIANEVIREKISKTDFSRVLRDFGYKKADADNALNQVLGESVRSTELELEVNKQELLRDHGLDKPRKPIYKSVYPISSEMDCDEFEKGIHNARQISFRPLYGENGFRGLVEVGILRDTSPDSTSNVPDVWLVSTQPDDLGQRARQALNTTLSEGVPLIIESKANIQKILAHTVNKDTAIVDVSKVFSQASDKDCGSNVADWSELLTPYSLDSRDDVGWHAVLHHTHGYLSSLNASIASHCRSYDFEQLETSIGFALSEMVDHIEAIVDLERDSVRKRAVLHVKENALLDALENKLSSNSVRPEMPESAAPLSDISVSVNGIKAQLKEKHRQDIDPGKARDLFPEVVDAIEQSRPSGSIGTFTQAELRAALNRLPESGMSAALREAVISECFLEVESGDPRVTVSPKYTLIYVPESEM